MLEELLGQSQFDLSVEQ